MGRDRQNRKKSDCINTNSKPRETLLTFASCKSPIMVAIFPYPCFISILLLVFLLQCAEGQAPSCQGYSKGDFSGNVINPEMCETACEIAEGLPTPHFKVDECTATTNSNDAVTIFVHECTCLRSDTNGNLLERQLLCDDGTCTGEASSGARLASTVQQLVAAVAVVAISFFS